MRRNSHHIMLWNQEIAEWQPAHRMGWLYYKGARIQLHISQLPKPHLTDYSKHIIQFDTEDIGYELIEGRRRLRRIRTIKKVLQVLPPRK